MKCPACEGTLKEILIDTVMVDVCKGACGGIWFDAFELHKVDEPFESLGECLLDIETDEKIEVDHEKRRMCPKCKSITMMRHFFSVKHNVEVDECPRCGGYWLDYGELGKIRRLYSSEEERKNAAEKYFSDLMDNELEEMRSKSQEQLEKANKIAKIFRFICPSYYIPGKQPWGAY